MTPVVGAAFGAAIAVGAVLVAAGTRRSHTKPTRRPTRPGARSPAAVRALVAVLAAVVVWVLTGWPTATAAAALAAAVAPSLVGGRARRADAVAVTEAVASWAENLRDTMAAAAGIQEAIVATAPVAPPPIRRQVTALAALLTRRPLPEALGVFAADVADPTADKVVAALTLADGAQASKLGDLLGQAASSARAEASMRARIEASRARTYVATRTIVAVTAGFTIVLVVFNRPYLAPFDTPTGQLVLAAVAALFAVAAALLARMARPTPPPRLFASEIAGGR